MGNTKHQTAVTLQICFLLPQGYHARSVRPECPQHKVEGLGTQQRRVRVRVHWSIVIRSRHDQPAWMTCEAPKHAKEGCELRTANV